MRSFEDSVISRWESREPDAYYRGYVEADGEQYFEFGKWIDERLDTLEGDDFAFADGCRYIHPEEIDADERNEVMYVDIKGVYFPNKSHPTEKPRLEYVIVPGEWISDHDKTPRFLARGDL